MSANAIDVLATVRSAGGDLRVTGGRLHLVAQAPLPPELVEQARAAKPALLALLSSEADGPADTAFIERAAIVEFDGDAPRAWAEGLASLDCTRPPTDVPPVRWRQFIDDAGRFLDEWAATAQALGWSAADLFGCNADRPFARIDQAGLLWLLRGDRLIKLTGETAILETRSGARQTYRRRPSQPGQVLAWELEP